MLPAMRLEATTTNKHTDALLPCPFCGGNAKIEIINHDHWQSGYIQCQHCRNRTQGNGTKAEELAKWNNRAALSPVDVAKIKDEAFKDLQLSEMEHWKRCIDRLCQRGMIKGASE